MTIRMVAFLAMFVIPACAFFAYVAGQFLREALQMRKERLAAMRIQEVPGKFASPARGRATVIEFLPNPGRHSRRGAA